MLDLFKSHNVTSYLEVGARHGDTFYDVMTSLPKGSRGVAVDLPAGLWGMSDSKDALIDCIDELSSMGYDVSVIFGDSQEVGVCGDFDATLIDGDHTYQGVRADFDKYAKCGLIALHDIDGVGLKYCGKYEIGVPQLWSEIKDEYTSWEFIDPSDDRPMGIGVIQI